MPATPNDPAKPEEPKPAPSSGGLKAWLPLILTVALMPGLAYAMTAFVLLPKLKHALTGQGGASADGGPAGAHGAGGHEPTAALGKPKNKAILSKIIVNVSGSSGTRLLLASFTLAGNSGDFKNKIEDNTDQLRDIASSTLASKTINDLEKPESRNQIRSELLSQFNAALGNGFIQEIYITELAIQ